LTQEEYDKRYKKPIPGFSRVQIVREKEPFVGSRLFWAVFFVAVAALMILIRILPGLSSGWGFAGLLVQILYWTPVSAGLLFLAAANGHRYKKRWMRILSLVICAALAIAMFACFAVPPIRDLFEKPVTGTFRVTETGRSGRYSNRIIAIDTQTGVRVSFPASIFSQAYDELRGRLEHGQPVIAITYYPHSKVRTHMEY